MRTSFVRSLSEDNPSILHHDTTSSFKTTITAKSKFPKEFPCVDCFDISELNPIKSKLTHQSAKTIRQRSYSAADVDDRCLVRLLARPVTSFDETAAQLDLCDLVIKADGGLRSGINPILAEGALGGTYFLRDRLRTICLVCKPGDQEPNAPRNPHQQLTRKGGWTSYKGGILPGFGMFREVAASLLDRGFAGVPPTLLARIRHPQLDPADSLSPASRASALPPYGFKTCSVQAYVRHEGSAEDQSPGKFLATDVQRVAVLDIRLCNLDRHEGNLLVCRGSAHLPEAAAERVAMSPFFSPQSRGLSRECPRESSANRPDSGCLLSDTPTSGFFLDQFRPSSSPSLTFSPSKAQSPQSALGALRLAPIDHGYCLPHILHLQVSDFAWLHWPQAKLPLDAELKEHVASLDCAADITMLKSALGAALPAEYLLTLRVCTTFLQLGVSRGLSLHDLGSAMCVLDADDLDESSNVSAQRPSRLQAAVHDAIRATLQARPRQNSIQLDDSSTHINSSCGPAVQSSSPLKRLSHRPSLTSSCSSDCLDSPRQVSSLLAPAVHSVAVAELELELAAALALRGGAVLQMELDAAVHSLVSALCSEKRFS